MAQESWKDAPIVADQPASRGASVYIPPAGPTPEEQAAAARAQRGLELQEQAAGRAAQSEARAQAEFEGTGGKPTEAQAKTAVLLTRIKGGFADIQAVRERNPEAQEAGLGETLTRGILGDGLISRKVAGADRRIVSDAELDILDGLLTLGTGAAYTREQLEGQRASYFPQYGDSDQEIAIKNQRMARLIESAKINAGPKWGEVESAITPFLPKLTGAPATATAPTLQVATGKTFSTDQDIANARILNELWASGATIDQMNAKSIELTTAPLSAEALDYLRANEGNRNLPAVSAASSGGREQPGAINDALVGAAGGLLRGSTANMAEELVNVIDPDTAQKLQAALQYGQEQAPVSSFAGELVGGVLSPLSRMGGAISNPIAREAVSGALYGGLYGAGEAAPNAGLSERLVSGVIGAATGGVGGAIGGKIAQRMDGGPAAGMADNVAPVADELGVPGAPGPIPTPPTSDMEAVVDLARRATSRAPGRTAARRELARMAKVNPAAQQAAERLGITLPPDVLSDNAQLLSLTGLSRSQVGSEAENAWTSAVQDTIKRSDAVMDELGATTDLAQLSDDVSARLNATMQGMETQAAGLRDEVTAAFKPSDRLDANQTKAALASVIDELGGLDQAKRAFTGEEKKLLAMLGEGEEAIQPTYAMVNRLRREMGEAIGKGKGPWADTDLATVKKYYAALAEDQLGYIEQVGGKELADKQRAANSLFSDMYAKREELQTLFGKDLSKSVVPLIRRAITSGSKGDAEAIRKVVANVPEEMRGKVLMSGLLAESAGKGAGNGGFSFANFVKSYRGIRANAPVYKEFVKYIGDTGDQTLIDLYAISRRMVEAENKVLKTGKANQAMIGQMNAENLLTKVAQSAGGRAVGTVATGAVAGPLVAGGTALASELATRAGGKTRMDKLHKLMSSDEFRGLMEKLAVGDAPDSAVNRVAASKPFVDFAKRLPIPQTFKSRAEWIKSAFAQAGGNLSTEPEPAQ